MSYQPDAENLVHNSHSVHTPMPVFLTGMSFLRDYDKKSIRNTVVDKTEEHKKLAGTDSDLRKLKMSKLGALLRSYGMTQIEIDGLKRWDRVHLLKDFSSRAVSDGIGGDDERRHAREQRLKKSDQVRKRCLFTY